jgi:hypothetical protein
MYKKPVEMYGAKKYAIKRNENVTRLFLHTWFETTK